MRKAFLLFLVMILMGCQTEKPTIISNEKGSVYYEIFVGSFYDSNEDGVGDIQGIIQQLPYLETMGIKGIWLTPIHPSPTYHKYDVLDYMAIDPEFGTMEDFEELLKVAKEKNIDILIDLVLNHSSDQHPWFIEAKKNQLNGTCDSEDSKCDYYNFTETQQNHSSKIQEGLYYEASFTGSMPDLNLDNPKVREEIKTIVTFWLDKGVKGFRLDASLHYYAATSRNVEFLGWLNDTIKEINPDAFMVSEVWTDENTILNHYESQLDSFFNFTGSATDGKFVKAVRNQSGASLAVWIETYQQKMKEINPNAVDTMFLSNHDQGRSGGYFGKDIEKTKFMGTIYLLSPGIPFIYYGEEIGMLGSGNDPNQRLPMPWGEQGVCANPPGVDYNNKFSSTVKEQEADKDSLLNHYRQVISIRNQYGVFERGEVKSVDFNHDALYGMIHRDENEQVLVIHNFSEETQTVQIPFEILNYHSIGDNQQNGNEIVMQPQSTVVINIKGE